MKVRFFYVLPLLILAGCAPHSDEHTAHDAGHGEHAHAEGVTFSAGHGLSVPSHTAAFIGLKVEDVEERIIQSDFRFSAQVYRGVADARLASTTPFAPTVALASGDVIPEHARLVGVGKSVSVKMDSGVSLTGHVSEIQAHTDDGAGHFDVTVVIDDPDARLNAGMFVRVRTPIGSGKPVTSVPRSALLQTAEGSFVYTTSGDHFVRTPVKAGVANEHFVEIADGLYSDDKVVTAAAQWLWMAELESRRAGKSCADGH